MDGFTGTYYRRGLVEWVLGLDRKYYALKRPTVFTIPLPNCFLCSHGGPSGESAYDEPSNNPFWGEVREELRVRGVDSEMFCNELSQNIHRCYGQGAFGGCLPMLRGTFLDRVAGALVNAGWSEVAEQELLRVRPMPDRDPKLLLDSLRPRPRKIVVKS
jgi:hypothetical protein